MREANSALGDVLMLSALATGAKHVDAALAEKLRIGIGNRNPGIGAVFRHHRASVVRALLPNMDAGAGRQD